MKRSKFTEEQVIYALPQAEAGAPVADVCRQLGVAEATFYTARLSGEGRMRLSALPG